MKIESTQRRPVKYCLEDLLTIEELAAKLKVKVRTVREWKDRRKIPFTRLHRRIYFSVGVVEAMLLRNAVPAAQPTPMLLEQGGAQTEGSDK